MVRSARRNLERRLGIPVLVVLGLLGLACAASRDGQTGCTMLQKRYLRGCQSGRSALRRASLGWTRKRASVTAFAAAVPDEIPEYARASIQFIIDAPRDRVVEIDGGSVRESLVIGNLGPRPMGQALLCLRNGKPASCGSAPASSRIPPATSALSISRSPPRGDRIDVLIVPDNQARPAEGHRPRHPAIRGRAVVPCGRPARAGSDGASLALGRVWIRGCLGILLLGVRAFDCLATSIERSACSCSSSAVRALRKRSHWYRSRTHRGSSSWRARSGAGQSRWWAQPSWCASAGKSCDAA